MLSYLFLMLEFYHIHQLYYNRFLKYKCMSFQELLNHMIIMMLH